MRTLLTIHRGKLWFLILFFEICISFLIIAFSPISSHTTKGVYDDPPPDDFCLTCHQQQGMELKFLDKTIDATINPTEFGLSVHSEEGINCVDCHSEISDYPHPAISQKNSRDFSLALLTICKDCHEEQAEKVQDSVHQNAFTEGNKEAAVWQSVRTATIPTRKRG